MATTDWSDISSEHTQNLSASVPSVNNRSKNEVTTARATNATSEDDDWTVVINTRKQRNYRQYKERMRRRRAQNHKVRRDLRRKKAGYADAQETS